MNSTFDTFADVFATPANGLSTGLPQLDRIAPLGPGNLAVLVGASGVGKSRIARHIADTVACTHQRGALTVSAPTTMDALDSSLAFRLPAVVVVDPLTALLDLDNPLAGPVTAAADPASGLGHGLPPRPLTRRAAAERTRITDGPAAGVPGLGAPGLEDQPEQHPVHPAELGRMAEQLRDLARLHHVPIVVCHRYSPIRDSVTSQIVSTEAANPLLDQADVVAVVRVLADPRQVGVELLRNRLGPVTNLRLPLPHDLPAATGDTAVTPAARETTDGVIPAPRTAHQRS